MASPTHTRFLPPPRERGFTLVELLVVIVILGVLLAVAVPAYLSRKVTTQDTVAKSDIRSLRAHVEHCAAIQGNYIPACDTKSDLEAANGGSTGLHYGYGPGQVEVDPCTESNPPLSTCAAGVQGYILVGRSKSGNTFYVEKLTPVDPVRYVCVTAGKGGCASDGTWD